MIVNGLLFLWTSLFVIKCMAKSILKYCGAVRKLIRWTSGHVTRSDQYDW